MVDSKISDAKKKIILLTYQGFTQSEVSQILTKKYHYPMTRQAVSKALASVRKKFYINNNF